MMKYKYVPEGVLTELCIPIKDIKERKGNPRINDQAAKELTVLIKEHDFRDPIEVDENNVITAGHTRLKAARLLKMEYVPAVPSGFASNAAAMAYAIANNRGGENAKWDNEQLARLFKVEDYISEVKMGFKPAEIKALMLSSDLPDDLPDIDLQGRVDGKSDFMVLQFESKEEMNRVLNRFGLPERQRVLPYKKLMERMCWRKEKSK